jgi:hypothetical protein
MVSKIPPGSKPTNNKDFYFCRKAEKSFAMN